MNLDENQILQLSQKMYLEGAGRKDVMEFMESNGMASEKIDQAATDSYLAVRDERKKIVAAEQKIAKSEGRKSGMLTMAGGAAIMVITVGILLSTGRLFYVALIIGFLTFMKGVASFAGY